MGALPRDRKLRVLLDAFPTYTVAPYTQVGARGFPTVWENILACGNFPGSWERQNLPSRSIMTRTTIPSRSLFTVTDPGTTSFATIHADGDHDPLTQTAAGLDQPGFLRPLTHSSKYA